MRYIICFLFLFVSSSILTVGYADTSIISNDVNQKILTQKNNGDTLQAALQQVKVVEQQNQVAKQRLLILKNTKQKQLEKLTPDNISTDLLEKADLDLSIASTNIDSTNLAQAQAQQATDAASAKISRLETQLQSITLAAGKSTAVRDTIASLQNQLGFQKAVLKSLQQLSQELSTAQQRAQDSYTIISNWKDKINELYTLKQKTQKKLDFQKVILSLQEQQKTLLNSVTELNVALEQLNPLASDYSHQQHILEVKILNAQEGSNLIHLQIVIARLKSQLSSLNQNITPEISATELNDNISQAQAITDELKNVSALVNRKMMLLEKRAELEQQRKQQGIEVNDEFKVRYATLRNLLTKYQQTLGELQRLNAQTNDYIQTCNKMLKQALARRQGLPGFSATQWQHFFDELLTMPGMALQAANALKDQLVIAYSKLNAWSTLSIVVVEFLWVWIWLMLRDIISRILSTLSDKRENISKNTVYILLQLIRRNLPGLFILAGLGILFWLTGLPVKTFAPIIYLAIVWFVFKFAIVLARLILLENVGDASGRDVILYNELKWALSVGGVLTVLTVLAHQLPVGYQVTDFFNRLFMLFMLGTSFVLLRNWQVAPVLVKSYVDNSRPYLMRLIKLLSFLIPLTILSTAVIGIFGYVDMAWAISRYEGIFLLVMSGYILARGFLKDFLDWLSEMFIRNLRNGWLWTQAVLKPLDRVLRIALFIGAGMTLFAMYGWGQDSKPVKFVSQMLHYKIVDAKGLVITAISVIELVVAGAVIYWISRWTREFSYRWLFAKTRDLGLRNSLAVLTQYTIFMVSLFIALKIIGIDLSGISYVLAGFAAGVGLGLRDLIKNYASGLLMLFERPVRTGDLVTIGECEGVVTQIGMRAVTVKTWDHMEVLVPNSDTFEKPFTNWTHLDSIVRTVIELKVSREDDPFNVQIIIFKTLEEINSVVSDPEPQVFFKEMSDALLCFEVRYYINLQAGISRAAVRSEVLFKIFSAFKQQGIKTPIPPQDIYLRNPQTKDDEIL